MKITNYAEGGASRSKNTLKSWTPQSFSAKTEIDSNLSLLRSRASSLYKNSALGAAAIETMTSNVINSGLKIFPRPRIKNARDWSRKVKHEFELWANDCDYLRRNNFYEMQQTAFNSALVEGDCFCIFKRRLPHKDNPYSLRLQLIEAGRVSNPLPEGALLSNAEMKRGNNRIVNGIEVDREGTLTAIWIANRYVNEPGVYSELKWQRVRWYGRDTHCRNVLMICKDIRPDQFRGVPFLAPVIEPLKQLARYCDSELTSSIIRSYYSVFFTQPTSNMNMNEVLGEDVDISEYKLGSATMSLLPRGVDVKALDSSNCQSTFENFAQQYIRQIGAALNLPFEVLLKSFNASYSASRAALLQATDEFRRRKAAFVTDFCKPIYEQWLAEAVALGRIDAPHFFDDASIRADYLACDFYNETSKAIDPLKSAQAMLLKLQNGLSTYKKELAENEGIDFDDVIEELKHEKELLEAGK